VSVSSCFRLRAEGEDSSHRRSVRVLQRLNAASSAAWHVSDTSRGDGGGWEGVGRELAATMAFWSLMRTPRSESKVFYAWMSACIRAIGAPKRCYTPAVALLPCLSQYRP